MCFTTSSEFAFGGDGEYSFDALITDDDGLNGFLFYLTVLKLYLYNYSLEFFFFDPFELPFVIPILLLSVAYLSRVGATAPAGGPPKLPERPFNAGGGASQYMNGRSQFH